MPQYLRFILDSDNDDHYTDSLIKLQSAPYVWYRLRRDGLARNILFLRVREDGQLVFHVYDDASRQHLMQFVKAHFSIFGKKEQPLQPDSEKDYPLQSLPMDEQDVLFRLLKADGTATLVFTHDAFERVCRKASDKSADQLTRLLNDKICNFPIYIRLPFRAEELEKCIHPKNECCPLLREAYRGLLSIPGDKPEPLLQAMTDVLGRQLLRLDEDTGDLFHLLLRMSIDDPNAPDSLEELADQAEYLELCRSLRIRLLKPQSEAERYMPVSRRELADLLQKPEFRDKVRQAVRELRAHHPGGSIRAALEQQMHLPDPLPNPAYRNEMALSLYIPDNCVSKVEWSANLDQAKRNLITLWSKPRNPKVLEIVTELCHRVRSATYAKNWVSLNEVLIQLKFFSEQICAPAERNNALDKVHEYGKILLDLCDNLQQRYIFSDLSGLDELAVSGINKADQLTLERMRRYIRSTILYFDRPELSLSDVVRRLEEDWATTQRDISHEIEILNHHADQQANLWQSAPVYHDDGDLSDLPAFHQTRSDGLYNPGDPGLNDDFSGIHIPQGPIDNAEPAGAAASPWDFTPDNRLEDDLPPAQDIFSSTPIDPDRYLEDHFHKNPFSYQHHDSECDFG